MSRITPITSADSRYGTLLSGFNQRWPSARSQRAEKIYVCSTEQDVLDALGQALRDPSLVPTPEQRNTHASRTGKRVTVRSGGHSYEGFVSDNPGGVIIDVGPLSGFEADVALAPDRYGTAEALSLGDGRRLEAGPQETVTYAYRLRPGTANWDGCVEMYKTGNVTLPGGSCYSVGAGGHICGGGYGLLSRLHGLTTDHLAGVDLVMAPDGKTPVLVHASRTVNPELFRLCRGAGGGTAGIITAYYFESLPVPPQDAVLLFLTVPWKQFEGLGGKRRFTAWLQRYGEHFRSIQDDRRSDGLFTLLHVTHHSTDMSLAVQFCAREEELSGRRNVATEANRVLRDLLDAVFLEPGKRESVAYSIASTSMQVGHAIIAEPVTVSSHRYAKDLTIPGAVVMTWLNAVQYLNGSGVNQRGKYKSAYLKEVTTSYAHGLYEVLTAPPQKPLKDELAAAGLKIPEGFDTTSLIVQMDSYGGSINRRADEGDAIWQRDSFLKVQYQVYWHDPAQDELYLAWMRKVYEAGFSRERRSGGRPWDPEAEHYQGCYINYPDVDMLTGAFGGRREPRSWLNLYFGPSLPQRLVAAKAAYDPFDVFRHAMSVPTAEPRP